MSYELANQTPDSAEEEVNGSPAKGEKEYTWKEWPKVSKVAGIIFAVCLSFVVGLVVGYLLQTSSCTNGNDTQERGQCIERIDYGQLSSAHNSVFDHLSQRRVENFSQHFGSVPAVTGSVRDTDLVSLMRDNLGHDFLSWEDVYEVKISLPDFADANSVKFECEDGSEYTLHINESSVAGIRFPYVAFSSPGVTKGVVVDLGSGSAEELDDLTERNVSLTDAVGLMRLTDGVSLTQRVLLAERMGVEGVLVFTSSPCDRVVPTLALNEAGDPRTPGIPSIEDVPQKMRTQGLPKILAQTISCRQAEFLQEKLTVLINMLLCMAEGRVTAEIRTYNREEMRDVTNVMSLLPGSSSNNEIVIIGANRNSFHGDALSGSAALSEIWHAVTSLYNSVETTWSTLRSILFVSWGGGDFGKIGIAEYMEELGDFLNGEVIAYVDLDEGSSSQTQMSVTSNLALTQFINRNLDKYSEYISQPVSVLTYNKTREVAENLWLNELHTSYIHLQYPQTTGEASWPLLQESLFLNSIFILSMADSQVLPLDSSASLTVTLNSLSQLLGDEILQASSIRDILLDKVSSLSTEVVKIDQLKDSVLEEFNHRLLSLQKAILRLDSIINKTRESVRKLKQPAYENQLTELQKEVDKSLVQVLLELNTLPRYFSNRF